jgi:DNA (cytosine-5)-methyltransferase 1
MGIRYGRRGKKNDRSAAGRLQGSDEREGIVGLISVGSLFSGIGGLELGLERTGGFKTIWQCEIDPFALKVLEKHWPDVKRFTDITKMGIEEDIPHADLICGGFPCQPISCAGKRQGEKDKRWLWPEFYRIICEARPSWVLAENVPELLSANSGRLFGGILRDLAQIGYDAEWQMLSAAQFGAPHLRRRIFVIAYSSSQRRQQNTRRTSKNESPNEGRPSKKDYISECNGESRASTDTDQHGFARKVFQEMVGSEGQVFQAKRRDWGKAPSPVCGVDDGVSHRLDRLRCLGNAVVSPVIEYIGKCILNANGDTVREAWKEK